MFKLVIQDDEGKTTVVPLIRDEITIGRKEGNTIRLTERNVSRRHARILRNNGEVQIEDLGSYNGIRVNNARIAERVSLRVSDQVQIGDYKLYLKAEGVEQVDDARTMPIERVENGSAVAATESMPAVPAPTAPVPVQTAPALATPPPGVVGSPNRTLVEMDGSMLQKLREAQQAGRPVADAAMVAKLSETASYGKLVVWSSNFAGKEFELSRPQMIIGRTDENDIVINHRSISRNHAKITRDPETGRYTISDLQSSNGVRVNGQDYGKVELRRGDTVDLGHVRLRFVEPGEDYVFSPSHVTDVPEGGGKRGMMAAIVIALLLVGAIGAYFAFFRTTEPGPGDNNGSSAGSSNGSAGLATVDAGSNVVAIATPDAAEQVVVTTPDAAVATTTVDAGSAQKDDAGEIETRCNQFKAKEQWQELDGCAKELRQYSPEKSGAFAMLAKSENQANILLAKLKSEAQKGDLDGGRATLNQIQSSSIYRAEAETIFQNAKDKALRETKPTAIGLAKKGDCEGLTNFIRNQAREIQGPLKAIECKKEESCPPDEVAQHLADAEKQFSAGSYPAALASYESVLKCKQDYGMLRHIYVAACKAGSFAKARAYYKQLNSADQNYLLQACPDFDPRK